MDRCEAYGLVYAEVAVDSVAERTMAWLARHTLHEGVHHLADIVEVTARVRDARR